GPERGANVLDRDVRVLDHIVQQGGRDGDRVHLLLGENGRDGDRVRDVVVARLALLAQVRLGAHAVGPRQEVEVQTVALQRDRSSQLRREQRCRGLSMYPKRREASGPRRTPISFARPSTERLYADIWVH